MNILFMYPPSGYLNHSMFKHYTYFAETIHLVSIEYSDIIVMDCGVEVKGRNEIYDAFSKCDVLVMLIEPYSIQSALSLAKIYKDINPQRTTIVYGTAAVLVPNYLAKRREVDYIIANGNFANGILKILRDVENGVEKRGHLYPTVGTADRPWGCALDASVPLERYRHFGNDMFEFTVQVGCPFHCSFCSEKLMFPKEHSFLYAQRPMEEVVAVLKRVKNIFKSVYFSATTLTYDRDWIVTICEEMIRKDCILPWRSDTRIDYLDIELLKLMKRAGLQGLSLGVESFEDHLLNSVNKRQQTKSVYEQILMCKESAVDVKALLILGLPGQSAEDVLHTQRIIENLGIAHRWKEYSPIRELYLADHRGEDVSRLIDDFSRDSFRTDSILGLSSESYMKLLFPHGYVR